MKAQLLPGGAIVWRDVCTGCQGAEEAVQVVARHEVLHDLDGLGNLGTVVLEFQIVQIEVENVPVAGVGAEAPNFVGC